MTLQGKCMEIDEKTFDEMSFQQKREIILMYEDKIGVIFKSSHLRKIFGNIRDSTFTEFSYNREKGYLDSHDASFLIDFLFCRITGKNSPSMAAGKKEFNEFIENLHNIVSRKGWEERLYSFGGLSGKPALENY